MPRDLTPKLCTNVYMMGILPEPVIFHSEAGFKEPFRKSLLRLYKLSFNSVIVPLLASVLSVTKYLRGSVDREESFISALSPGGSSP